MPRWTPQREWADADAVVIGGGPSLKGFPWESLKGRKTIGCNAAFRQGIDVCTLSFFEDIAWFNFEEANLESFPGRVATSSEEIPEDHPWVYRLERKVEGLHTGGAVGFGGNTGCSAINLALLMGAKRVFLIGFDCRLGTEREMNWHNHRHEPANESPELFLKFQEGFYAIARDREAVFPDCQIINCTPHSALRAFPTMRWEDIKWR